MREPTLIIVDAIQQLTELLQQRFENGERSYQIDADDLIEVLLAIAERIEPATSTGLA